MKEGTSYYMYHFITIAVNRKTIEKLALEVGLGIEQLLYWRTNHRFIYDICNVSSLLMHFILSIHTDSSKGIGSGIGSHGFFLWR